MYAFRSKMWQDFTKAERVGTDEVKNTYKSYFKNWKTNYKYLTELVFILNAKSKEYNSFNIRFAKLYNKLYEDANDYAIQHLKGKDLDYYFERVG
jgi:hypothetical protein